MLYEVITFLSLYLGLETQSLALYLIAAYQRDTVRSTEAVITSYSIHYTKLYD